MASVLEIDWGSKSAKEIEEGSVNKFIAHLVSPRRLMSYTCLLCRVGRCPVKDCCKILENHQTCRHVTAGTLGDTVTVWICKKCDMIARRSAQVNAQEDYSSPIGKS